MTAAGPELETLLATRVSVAGVEHRFGELTPADVRAHAAALAAGTGLGHRSRVGAVAAAWSQLVGRMEAESASTVDELEPKTIRELAEALWIVPPGGSLLP